MLWKLSTGAAWRDLPERCGPWKTVCERFRNWSWVRTHLSSSSNSARGPSHQARSAGVRIDGCERSR
ncbi:transposase [Streptomyces sp. SID4950]|nr:transposase [Streptomyces sp. SID4950]